MNAFIKRACARRGFSLVEILATIAIITILIALFVPALNKVGEVAGRVRQKAQFSNIEIALEAYNNDYGDYPISGIGIPLYTGTQVLGEAIVGLDGLGFHPDSIFSRNRVDGAGNEIYYPGIGSLSQDEQDANLQRRTGPYLENDAANAVRLGDIYEVPPISSAGAETMVLADMFTKKMNTGIKTGMPILYYSANTAKSRHDPTDMANNIYKYSDNSYWLVNVGAPWGSVPHSMTLNNFYIKTRDPRFTVVGAEQPYRSQSFILISAGKDGLYGTADDIYNFDRVEQ